MWTIKADIETDYYRDVIANEVASLPPHDQTVGHVQAHWRQLGDGRIYIASTGGTPDDRLLVEAIVWAQLGGRGFKRATVDPRQRTSEWDDVMSKARRLIQSGNVQILRNGPQIIVGQVQGDHGTYQPEIYREYPGSPQWTGSKCQCGWGEFQNLPRTREWKRFQDRPCSHIMATYYVASAMPLDEDRAPGNQPGQGGQMSLFDIGSGGQAPSTMGLMQQQVQGPAGFAAPMQNANQPPAGAQMSLGEAPGPSPADVLPQFQNPNDVMPQVNPASVPGLRQPSPTNPVGYIGPATFSSWRPVRMHRMAEVAFTNGNLVQLKQEDMGTLVGRSEAHGAGQPTTIPTNSIGEVLGVHPSTGMVNVLYMGNQFDKNGPMEPYGATAWHWPSDLLPRPDVRAPGPAIRRPKGLH